MVALVAEDAALASIASVRNSSLPLPFEEMAYERRAAWHVMVCRMEVIILRSVASTNSGATIYRLASSGVSAGKAETGAVAVGAAAPAAACACERVWRVVACRFEGAVDP
eukprot:2084809-Pleurochrysis_carterae.AAC.1